MKTIKINKEAGIEEYKKAINEAMIEAEASRTGISVLELVNKEPIEVLEDKWTELEFKLEGIRESCHERGISSRFADHIDELIASSRKEEAENNAKLRNIEVVYHHETGAKEYHSECFADRCSKSKEESKEDLLEIGEAMQALKEGRLLTRKAWNGKGMFVYKQIGLEIDIQDIMGLISMPDSVKKVLASRFAAEANKSESIRTMNHYCMVYPDNRIFGWSPSGSDLAATDWIVVG